MVILIGIEGAEGDATKPNSAYQGSFIHKMVQAWPDKGASRYVAGPKVQSGGIANTAAVAFSHAGRERVDGKRRETP